VTCALIAPFACRVRYCLTCFWLCQVFGVGQSSSSRPAAVLSPEYLRFRRSYVLVYLIMMAADWMQGPYVYALYKYYGYGIGSAHISNQHTVSDSPYACNACSH
jgi:hypothetical protein